MDAVRPPPTSLGSRAEFAVHLNDTAFTVFRYHRRAGPHGSKWEKVEQTTVGGQLSISGEGTLIKDGEDVWYLLDEYDDLRIAEPAPEDEPGGLGPNGRD